MVLIFVVLVKMIFYSLWEEHEDTVRVPNCEIAILP